jgi:alpha-L-rhamnosidase
MADAIGENGYADTLRTRYEQGKDSFNRLYVDPQTGFTLNATPGNNVVDGRTLQDSQASYATPLNLDLFSDEMTVQAGPDAGLTYQEFATKRLRELVEEPGQSNNGNGPRPGTGLFSGGQASNKPYTLTTGFNGTPNILPALTKSGEAETAYKLFSSDEFASWLYPVSLGATSMWELWNAYERALGQGGQSAMNSQNHFALGASQAWMYEYQLGITTDGAKGYRDFVLQPVAGGDFTSLEGSYDSNYGLIDSSWKASEGVISSYATTVPANTTATLYLPVEEDVTAFEEVPGVTFVGMTERNGLDVAQFELGAGGYEFEVDGGSVTATLDGGYVVDEDSATTKTATSVKAQVRPKSPKVGTRPKIVVTVSADGATPVGRVHVSKGDNVLGRGKLNADGKVAITLRKQKAGVHKLLVVYLGTKDFEKSRTKVTLRIRR